MSILRTSLEDFIDTIIGFSILGGLIDIVKWIFSFFG